VLVIVLKDVEMEVEVEVEVVEEEVVTSEGGWSVKLEPKTNAKVLTGGLEVGE